MDTQLPGLRSHNVVTLLSLLRPSPCRGTVPVMLPRLTEIKVTRGLVKATSSKPLELKNTGMRFGSFTES